jgi:hypothetical protein
MNVLEEVLKITNGSIREGVQVLGKEEFAVREYCVMKLLLSQRPYSNSMPPESPPPEPIYPAVCLGCLLPGPLLLARVFEGFPGFVWFDQSTVQALIFIVRSNRSLVLMM